MFFHLDEKRKFFDKLHNPHTLTGLKEGNSPEDSISSEKYI